MEYKIIKVFEIDYDYSYERLFLVKIDEEQYNELLQAIEKYDDLDYEEAVKIYGMGKIEFVENYIMNNFETINSNLIEIDCY